MNYYLLQAPGGGMGSSSGLIFMGLIMVVFWLFFIRPQAKKAKQQKTFTEELKPGDRVVTGAGIHGRLGKINDDGTIQLEVNPGSYIKMEKSAVSMELTQQMNKTSATTSTEKK